MVGASNKIGTSSVRPSYVALIHPNVEYDLESVPGYKSISDYGDTSGLMPGEVGSYKNIRFVTSTLAAVFLDVGAAVSGTGKASTTGNKVKPVLNALACHCGQRSKVSTTAKLWRAARSKYSRRLW